MLEVVALALAGIVAYYVFGSMKVRSMNKDIEQQRLASILKAEASDPYGTGMQTQLHVILQGWKGRELRTRLTHACSIVKVSAMPEVYEKARTIAYNIYVSH